jgi:hypothetical protein
VDTQGDAFFFAFASPVDAVAAAQDAQLELASGTVSVRMGLHTGSPHLTGGGYVGEEVHLGARVAAAGHGGQVLLSATTRELVTVEASDLGEHRRRGSPGGPRGLLPNVSGTVSAPVPLPPKCCGTKLIFRRRTIRRSSAAWRKAVPTTRFSSLSGRSPP